MVKMLNQNQKITLKLKSWSKIQQTFECFEKYQKTERIQFYDIISIVKNYYLYTCNFALPKKKKTSRQPKILAKQHASAADDTVLIGRCVVKLHETTGNIILSDRAPYLIFTSIRRPIYAGVLMLRGRVSNQPKGTRYNITYYVRKLKLIDTYFTYEYTPIHSLFICK